MTCSETLRTQAWLDGELQDEAAAQAERHAETCAECQQVVADAAAVNDALRLVIAERASRPASRGWPHPNLGESRGKFRGQDRGLPRSPGHTGRPTVTSRPARCCIRTALPRLRRDKWGVP